MNSLFSLFTPLFLLELADLTDRLLTTSITSTSQNYLSFTKLLNSKVFIYNILP